MCAWAKAWPRAALGAQSLKRREDSNNSNHAGSARAALGAQSLKRQEDNNNSNHVGRIWPWAGAWARAALGAPSLKIQKDNNNSNHVGRIWSWAGAWARAALAFEVHFMQPGLHKVDIGYVKLNDAEKLRGPFYAARAA